MWPRDPAQPGTAPKIISFPKGAPAPRRPRDPRIDAFRGIALVMIFIDHVPGNPYEGFTLRNWGFSDAAESFFVMSGIAAGLAYSRRFEGDAITTDGAWAAIRPVWSRSWTLYLTHLLLSFWAIAIFAWGASTFLVPELLETINLRQVFQNTHEALLGIPLLGHQMGYVNILPAYSVLLLAAPLALFAGLRWPAVTMLASIALWFASGLYRLNLPNFPNPGGWFFNPLAWQVIFVVGLLTGTWMRRGKRLVPVNRWLFALAAGWLLFVLAWRYVPHLGPALNQGMSILGKWGAPFHLVSHDKTFVALPRLLHVLALVYVLSCLPQVTRACGSAFAAPFRLMGRQGLLVFSAGTLLSLLFQVLMAAEDQSRLLPWLLPPLGIGLSILIAAIAERASAKRARGVVAPPEQERPLPEARPAE